MNLQECIWALRCNTIILNEVATIIPFCSITCTINEVSMQKNIINEEMAQQAGNSFIYLKQGYAFDLFIYQ